MARQRTNLERRAYGAALTWARNWGLGTDHLPRGDRNSATTCPLSLATGWVMATPYAAPPDEGRLVWYHLPALVVAFLDMFDNGRFPELERK